MPAAAASPEPTTILVVDDEEGIRQALERFLTRLGYRVLTAEDAAAALTHIPAGRAAAMLCDIRMPAMSGVELVPKALAQDADLAILMLTAIDEPRTAIECLKLGAFDYLIKPVDLEELELSLRNALRRRQLEIDRRGLEQWLAREVAQRTRDLEERTAAIRSVALDALAAAPQWSGAAAALQRLADEMGESADALRREVEQRRAGR